MSNVRSFKDLQSQGNNLPSRPGGRSYGFGNPGSQPLSNRDTSADLEENSQNNSSFGLIPGVSPGNAVAQVFPQFKMRSFTFIVSVLQLSIFLITELASLFYEQKKDNHDATFTCVLYDFGAKYSPSINANYQFHRLVLPIFLHAGVAHILFNLFSQNMYGYALEEFYGRKKFIALYFAAGIGGNLLSAVWQKDSISVGASSSLFGVFALNVAYIIQNYEKFGNRKRVVLGVMIIIIALNFFAVPTDDKEAPIDVASHIGNLLIFEYLLYFHNNRRLYNWSTNCCTLL